MKTIDGDLKKLQDDLNETRNIYNQVAKKEGANFQTKDLGDIIYNSQVSSQDFVEKLGSETLSTLIAIVHKAKVPQFLQTYETVIDQAAVPRSAKYLQQEDKEGNQLWRIVVLSVKLDNYINEAKRQGILVKRFSYDIEKFKSEQENKTKLE